MLGRFLKPPRPDAVVPQQLLPLIALVNGQSQPNHNALRLVANAIDPLSLNIKQLGYTLARQLAEALPARAPVPARRLRLPSGLSTQAAIESDWVAHWCGELRIPVVYHRKIWELCFVLQQLYEADLIRPGMRGLGFGCGTEPLPSYFAAHGIHVTATDLAPDRAAANGWVHTGQHTGALDQAYMVHLVDRPTFDRQVGLRHVDMNIIPDDLAAYDFCWSICALEHLGSIAQGLDFIDNAMKTLRPGGVAVHTTEFNINDEGVTIDNWPSVAFQRKHMEAITARLRAQGHHVVPFDYALGDGPLDRFVDLPPWTHEMPASMAQWIGPEAHLKLAFDGIVITCAGIAIRKAD